MNPRELLPDYVLGLLSPEERVTVERYLETSQSGREELMALQQTFIHLSENAPREIPRTSFQDIQRQLSVIKQTGSTPQRSTSQHSQPQKVKPAWFKELRDWRNYMVAASLALAVLGLSWGLSARQEARRATAENETINHWLAYGDLSMVSLRNQADEPIGTVLVSPRDYALFILDTPPPAGKNYQAWGRANGTITSLAVADGRLIEVNCEGFERIGVSLEPVGGSPQPTEPLGGIPLE
jgi:anti-sigma-K factor RskA